MPVRYSEKSREIHIYNDFISYIIQVLDNGALCNLYYGKKIAHKEDFGYLLEGGQRSLAVYTKPGDYFMSPQYTRMEYPCTGTGDFREPAFEVRQEDGSSVMCMKYCSHQIFEGKKKLEGLPAVYTEKDQEAETLEIRMQDDLTGVQCILSYTVFREYPALTRSVRMVNSGKRSVVLERVLSASIDLPDSDYKMISLTGAWARERWVRSRRLEHGVQSTGSRRGCSSAEFNPFLALARPDATEHNGTVIGFSLVYSGNHLEQVDVDTCGMARVQIGIHPDGFSWKLEPGETFQSPEAVIVYSESGLNGMSQTYHAMYRTRLARGFWRDRPRPILINNWEATGPDFTEDSILRIAETAKELGVEMFVLDDGWFGSRNNDYSGLGDWNRINREKLPDGITRLAEKIEKLGMKFGVWIEPEMVNEDSELFRSHPDWILCAPGRTPSPSRNQYVLDFSRPEVVDYVCGMIEELLEQADISYVKWDMNRYITECWSKASEPEEQGKVLHKYILGVYRMYERLTDKFPEILFESCASGGARFDPGMLYYAPQTWTSDDTDAMERLKIQYGTSYVYPLSSMGSHVSAVPNQQVGRSAPLETRGNVALFGTFGYELDLNSLSEREKEKVKVQILFSKAHRKLVQQGVFYRLKTPFSGDDSAWMVVSEDRTEALVGYFRERKIPNGPWRRLYLAGLEPEGRYRIKQKKGQIFGGDELMNAGMVIGDSDLCAGGGDYSSAVFYLRKIEKGTG